VARTQHPLAPGRTAPIRRRPAHTAARRTRVHLLATPSKRVRGAPRMRRRPASACSTSKVLPPSVHRPCSAARHSARQAATRRLRRCQIRPEAVLRGRPGRPSPANAQVWMGNALSGGGGWSASASTLTMASERLSPPPRARMRALSIKNSVASRGESDSTTEASSDGEK